MSRTKDCCRLTEVATFLLSRGVKEIGRSTVTPCWWLRIIGFETKSVPVSPNAVATTGSSAWPRVGVDACLPFPSLHVLILPLLAQIAMDRMVSATAVDPSAHSSVYVGAGGGAGRRVPDSMARRRIFVRTGLDTLPTTAGAITNPPICDVTFTPVASVMTFSSARRSSRTAGDARSAGWLNTAPSRSTTVNRTGTSGFSSKPVEPDSNTVPLGGRGMISVAMTSLVVAPPWSARGPRADRGEGRARPGLACTAASALGRGVAGAKA